MWVELNEAGPVSPPLMRPKPGKLGNSQEILDPREIKPTNLNPCPYKGLGKVHVGSLHHETIDLDNHIHLKNMIFTGKVKPYYIQLINKCFKNLLLDLSFVN